MKESRNQDILKQQLLRKIIISNRKDHKTKNWLVEKSNKIDKPLAILIIKKKREGTL